MKILLVYPEFPDTFWSFKHAVTFIGKKAGSPPLGLATVAAMLPTRWEKRLVDMNVTRLKQSDLDWADFIFISAMDVQRASVRTVIARCKAGQKTMVAGGPLFTAEYESFPDVNYFVLNEGEITLPLFLADLEKGTPQRIYKTDQYPDIRSTPVPMWELVDMSKYDSMNIQFSRGCPFNCEFCNVTALLGHRPRTKSKEQIIAELDKLYSLGWRRSIFFVDDNFIGNKKELKQDILPALIEWRKGKEGFLFTTEVSINLADDTELTDLMVKAGFINIFVGIETPDEDSLAECHKTQNISRNLVDSVKKLQRAGLQVMAGFIVGFDSDTPTIFQRQIDFIQKSGIVTAMVGLLQAPHGTQLYERMAKDGRLLNEMSGDNGDGTSNIVPKMDAEVLRNGYLGIIEQIYSPKLFYMRIKTFLAEYRPLKMDVSIHFNEVVAFFKSVWKLGIIGRERWQYWNLFFWTLFHYPRKFAMAITLSIYGYHFRTISELHIFERNDARTAARIEAGKGQLVSTN
jgi:radical SAM superfamily enzyme YgiQ (UPF0313 family)